MGGTPGPTYDEELGIIEFCEKISDIIAGYIVGNGREYVFDSCYNPYAQRHYRKKRTYEYL